MLTVVVMYELQPRAMVHACLLEEFLRIWWQPRRRRRDVRVGVWSQGTRVSVSVLVLEASRGLSRSREKFIAAMPEATSTCFPLVCDALWASKRSRISVD